MTKINIRKPHPVGYFLSIVFVIMGWNLTKQALYEHEGLTRYVILFLGIANILIFSVTLYAVTSRFFDKTSGLQMNDEKLFFKPNKFQSAELYWNDISEIKFKEQRGQHYILPIINRPEETIATQNNWFGKKIMKFNFRKLQTPILIDANNYDTSYEQLKNLITDQFNKVKRND